jgi:hypothetical protein
MSPASCSLSRHDRDIRWDNEVRGPRTQKSGRISSPSYPSMLGGLGRYIEDYLAYPSTLCRLMATYRYGVVRSRIGASQLVAGAGKRFESARRLSFELNLIPRVGLDHKPRLHYITSTSPSAQCSAMVCKPGKEFSLDMRILQAAAIPRNPSRLPYKEEVAGSNPASPTHFSL